MRNTLLLFVFFASYQVFSQEANIDESGTLSYSVNAAGGTIKNESGSMAFSIGQIYHDISQTQKEDGSLKNTIQQANEINQQPNLNMKDNASIILYPNPFTNHFVIKITDGQYELSNYNLYDLQGKLLLRNQLNKSQTRVNLNFLSTGVYLVKIIKQNTIVKTIKILKN